MIQFERIEGRRKPIRISQGIKKKLPSYQVSTLNDQWGTFKDKINSPLSLTELLHQPLPEWSPFFQQEYENRPGLYSEILDDIVLSLSLKNSIILGYVFLKGHSFTEYFNNVENI